MMKARGPSSLLVRVVGGTHETGSSAIHELYYGLCQLAGRVQLVSCDVLGPYFMLISSEISNCKVSKFGPGGS